MIFRKNNYIALTGSKSIERNDLLMSLSEQPKKHNIDLNVYVPQFCDTLTIEEIQFEIEVGLPRFFAETKVSTDSRIYRLFEQSYNEALNRKLLQQQTNNIKEIMAAN
jgi:hypothetical protein